MTPSRVLLITDPRVSLATTLHVVREAARAIGPLLAVQFRDKSGASPSFDVASELRAVTQGVGVRLVVNGPLALAEQLSADGLHIPDRDDALERAREAREALGPTAFITMAAHDNAGVRRAIDAGVTGVVVSPIYATPGKGPPRGVAAIGDARALALAHARTPLLVYALGGVDEARASACAEAGADGVAVIRALLAAPDPALAARRLAAPRWPPLPVAGCDDEC